MKKNKELLEEIKKVNAPFEADIWDFIIDLKDDRLEIKFTAHFPFYLCFKFNIVITLNKNDSFTEIFGKITHAVSDYYSCYNVDNEACKYVEENKEIMQMISIRKVIVELEIREEFLGLLSREMRNIYNNL